MAEAALLLVIQKIATAVALNAGSILANRAAAVVAIPNNMIMISNELELLQAFFMDSEMKGRSDQVTETLVSQARRLAYEIEDIVDQYIYVVGTPHQKGSLWFGCVKKVAKKPQSLYTLDQIASGIQKINQRLQQLKQNRDWTQPTLGDFPEKSYDRDQQLYLPGQDYLIADDELVGLDKNRESLINSLHLEDHPHLMMIAVWGMGGIGKSTLVSNVYREQAANFQCHAWIPVSQSYKLDQIFQQMLEKLNVQDNSEPGAENTSGMRSEEPRVKLKRFQQNKKYLIILDDVWRSIDLLKIKEVLIDNGLGSRVIITTRSHDVASIADEGCKLKVDKLEDNDAWQLFCRKAFPKNDDHICPIELHEYAKGIVDRCDGLPLALVAIGSMLSLRTNSAAEWKLFQDQLIWELGNNKDITIVGRILHLSYKDLPIYLKNCFLYCAIFPEDFAIEAAYLIKLLISEGFIDGRGTCSLEDIARGYIIELVRRNMLHVTKTNSYGEINYLQMHDLVRELAILQARKESFSTVYDCTTGVVPAGLGSRRIGLHKCNEDLTSSIDTSKARTILCFDKSMQIDIWPSILEECKYIAVMDFSNLPIEVIPESIGELFNLKYLNLDVTEIKELPKSIRNLCKLQTLSLEGTNCLVLPKGAKKLKNLRHILIWKDLRSALSFRTYESFEPFEGLWCLKELRTLYSVKASTDFVEKIGNLSLLRILVISDVKGSNCLQLCRSLSKMLHLQSLSIRAFDENEVLQLEALAMPKPLQSLTLEGRLSEGTLGSPFFSNHGHALFELTLAWSMFVEDPLPQLSGLQKLTRLDLKRAYQGQRINFRYGWFPHLKVMQLRDLPHVNQICIGEGALGCLEELIVHKLVELRSGPQQLRTLKYVNFTELHPDFGSS